MDYRDIRSKESFMDGYCNPRISAEMAYALSIDDTPTIATEIEIDIYVNNILDRVIQKVNDCRNGKSTRGTEFHTFIDFSDRVKSSVKIAVVNTIRDLGYIVKSTVDSDEEVKYVEDLYKMAESEMDDDLLGILDEAFYANNSFGIYWEQNK